MAIRSAAEYDSFASQRDKIMDRWLKQAAGFTATRVILRMRATRNFIDVTGNLRGSIGVTRSVSASPHRREDLPHEWKSLAAGKPPTKASPNVRGGYFQGQVVMMVGVGMVYAKHVQARRKFSDEAVGLAGPWLTEAVNDAMKLMSRDISKIKPT